MSIVDDLKTQITANRIRFDPPATVSERLRKELLQENSGTQVTSQLQNLVLEISNLVSIRISSIVRNQGHHGAGRAFDVGNEEVAATLLPLIATDAKVGQLKIDEIIFDAQVAGQQNRNFWNYDRGAKHAYDESTLAQHGNHIHFAVLVQPTPLGGPLSLAKKAEMPTSRRSSRKSGSGSARKRMTDKRHRTPRAKRRRRSSAGKK